MNTVNNTQTFSLDELCALTDLTKRTVRYYVQIGLVNRPEGETRAAKYSPQHLEQLLLVKKWTAAGVSLDRIRELLQGGSAPVPERGRVPGSIEVCSHLHVAEGVELVISKTLDADRNAVDAGGAKAVKFFGFDCAGVGLQRDLGIRQQ